MKQKYLLPAPLPPASAFLFPHMWHTTNWHCFVPWKHQAVVINETGGLSFSSGRSLFLSWIRDLFTNQDSQQYCSWPLNTHPDPAGASPPAPTCFTTPCSTFKAWSGRGKTGWSASREDYPSPTPSSLLLSPISDWLSILSGVHKARRTLAQERGVGVRQTGQGGSWLKFNHNILGLYCFEWGPIFPQQDYRIWLTMLDNNAELGWASPSSCQYEKVNTTPRFQKGLPAAPKPYSPILTPKWGEGGRVWHCMLL